MVRWSRGRMVGVALAVALMPVLLGACSSDEPSTEDCRPVAPGSSADGTTVLEVAAKNMAFDFGCIEVQPGPVVITFTNEDSGVPHNLRVRGQGVNEATDLEKGPSTQELDLDLTAPGTYEVKCDPHPSMKATIVVADPAAEDPPAAT